ncbi:MAG: response regulator [Nitrospirae bacterium]|nr:response regulator [Candidatus Manganitrophaceae bacterium]
MNDDPKINILIVDDHPENLLALEATLESPSYHLIRASSGQEALRQARSYNFAVILMDVQMPGLDGFATARLIRELKNAEHTPVIFMSAIHKAHQHIYKGYSAGAVDYLFTPFDPDIVRSKVAVFVDLFKKSEQIAQQAHLLQQREQSNLLELDLAIERRRNLAEAMPLIVFTARPDGTIDYINQKWFTYTGLTFKESVGWEWTKAIHPDDLQKCLDRLTESIRIGGGADMRCRLRNKEAVYRWHLIQTTPERDPSGEIIAWLGSALDIHDQNQEGERPVEKSEASP